MPKRFFELNDDVGIPGRWELGELLEPMGQPIKDSWRFTGGTWALMPKPLRIPIEIGGDPLDFSHAAFSTPIVHSRVAALFAERAPQDVQILPVQIEGQSDDYFILNAIRLVKCIDDQASDAVNYWKPEDGVPEKVGQYFSIHGLRIDTSKVGDAKVFRTWGWESLVISEDIKDALEEMGTTGMNLKEVTGPGVSNPEEHARDRSVRELLESAAEARESVWRNLGALDEDVFMPIAMSSAWPGQRQLWCVIRREAGHTLLVTHGLSDPFLERLEPSVGFGLELALEVDASVKDISKGWPLTLLDRVANEIAGHEQVREGVKAGLFSMEVSGKGMPKSLITEQGRVGVLLGVASRTLPRQFSTPFGEVRLVTIKVLLPSELAYVLEHGAEGHAELARRFEHTGEEHRFRARRRPVT